MSIRSVRLWQCTPFASTECGVVNDFDPSPQLERLITKELQSLLESEGFAESHHLFDVHGICGTCRTT